MRDRKKVSCLQFTHSKALRGSLTVEAALSLPLVLLMMAGILFLFSFLTVETKVQAAIDRVGENTAACYYGIEMAENTALGQKIKEVTGLPLLSEGLSSAAVKALVTDEMEGFAAGEELLAGGTAGLVFLGSGYDAETKNLTIRTTYALKIPVLPFSGLLMPVTQQAVYRAYVGQELAEKEEEQTVYVAENGKVYHTALTCTYLKLSIRQVDTAQVPFLRNADGGKYSACELCGKGSGTAVFITDYGDRYHYNQNCSGLKRGIRSIPLSQVGELPECSRCRAREGK